MANNTLELRRKLSLQAFYRLAHELANEYANTIASKARSTLMEQYDITESAYYTLLEFSITHHLVSDSSVKKIRKKIIANQIAHGNRGFDSKVKYNRLEEERKNYSAFSKKDIAEIARFYAINSQYTKQEVASLFGFYDTKVLNHILKKACVECIITENVFRLLRDRALSNISEDNSRVIGFFESLSVARTDYKMFKKAESSEF